MTPRRDVTGFRDVILAIITSWTTKNEREDFEDALAKEWGVEVARAVASGRAGLKWLMETAKPIVPPLAYVPAFTIPAVPEICRRLGYRIAFVDIDPDTLSVTPEVIERAYQGPGILIVTHYFGLPADMKEIMAVAKALHLEVVEDCAHAPGGKVHNQYVGSFGLGGIFSFETRKPLNTLGGGAIVSSDSRIAQALRKLEAPQTTPSQDLLKLALTTLEWLALRPPAFSFVAKLLHSEKGKTLLVSLYRRSHAIGRDLMLLSDFRCKIGLKQLQTLRARVARKREIAKIYDQGLPEQLLKPISPQHRPHQYFVYAVQCDQAREFGNFLRCAGIDCGIGEEVLQLCAPKGSAPGTEEALRRLVELPMHEGLSIADAEKVCAVARKFFER